MACERTNEAALAVLNRASSAIFQLKMERLRNRPAEPRLQSPDVANLISRLESAGLVCRQILAADVSGSILNVSVSPDRVLFEPFKTLSQPARRINVT
jgi:hypothetical protein